jgi:hypothetical protein
MAAWEELTIAEGTEWETLVLDVRHVRKWCEPSGGPQPRPPALIVWHHTVGNPTNVDQDGQLQAMRRMADVDTFGLPYNFLVWPGDHQTIWYLNDVDGAWPHTLHHNSDAVAISLHGNYEANEPDAKAVAAMHSLTNALMSMWGAEIDVKGHRDTSATACPGKYLYAALRELLEATPAE